MADFSLLDQAAPLMKKYYSPERVYRMAFKNRPLYAWLPKRTGVVGEDSGYVVPVGLDDIAGESADFASAVAARDGDSFERWQLYRCKRYGTATLDGETMEAMGSDLGAFMRATQPRINSAINQLANSTAWALYRDGTGARAPYATAGVTAGAGGTIVLDNAEDARSIGLRRTMQVSATASGGTLLDGGSTAKVTGVNIATGTITFDTVPAGWDVATAFLFMSGDYSTSATRTKVIDGMASWGPTTAPAPAALFKGVDRIVMPEKLLMQHYPASGVDIDTAVREAAATVQSNEGSPDALFLSPLKWAALETKLASQSRYEMMMGSDAATGFDSIVINAGGGKINVVADPWCPDAKGYMLQKNTWEMFSIKSFPGFVSDDGQRLARIMDADAVEFRMGGYYNTACKAPGHNIVIDFDVTP